MLKTRTELLTETREGRTVAPEATGSTAEPDGLWSIAMLRIAMELKRPGAPGLQDIVDGVVAKMGIPKEQFETYLSENLGILKQDVRRKGYVP